jgi:putative ABC transport system permease protein
VIEDPARPPGFWRWLLVRVVSPADREFLTGDLDEEFARLSALSQKDRRRWYRWQVVRSVWQALRTRRDGQVADHGRRGVRMSWDAMVGDVRHAMRSLVRNRGFAAVAVVTLGLGIGATTTMFGVVRALLLQRLPYPEADRLVSISSMALTPENYEEWRDGLRSLERLGVLGFSTTVLTSGGPAEVVRAHAVSQDYLPLLGARAAQGRLWTADEYEPSAAPAAVLTDGMWRRLYGDVSFTTGRAVAMDDVRYDVIGVLDPEFRELRFGPADVFVPIAHRETRGVAGLGRLREGIPLAAAEEEILDFAERQGAVELAARAGIQTYARIDRFIDVLTFTFRDQVLVLFAAAGIVLVIACANVSNLLLSRAAARTRELSVRSALGAGRGALLRVLLFESGVLALAGGALGILLAWWLIRIVPRLAPPHVPRLGDIQINAAVMGFAVAASVLATLIAGLAPAFAAARTGSAGAHFVRMTSGRTARRWRETLIVGEVALALVLSICTVLLVRTYLALRPTEPGFETADRIVAHAQIPPEKVTTGQAVDFLRTLRSDIESAHSGVRVAASTSVPLSGSSMLFPIARVDGDPLETANDRAVMLHVRLATPNYLDVIGVPIVRGRGLSEDDAPGSPHALVINEAAARRFWPDENNVLGRTLALEIDEDTVQYTIVGVAADARLLGGITDARPEVWASFWQLPWSFVRVVVHAPPGTNVTGPTLREAAARVDPSVAISRLETLASIAAESNAHARFEMSLMSGFGGLAFVLALIGCYSVLAHLVTQRRREIGVRMALGATRRKIVRLVVGRGLVLALLGIAIGTLIALALTRILESRLYGVSATDPITFSVTALAMIAAAAIAALLPASRAASVAPVTAISDS